MKKANVAQGNIDRSSFATIFEQTPISTQIFAADGTSLTANKAWEKLWGIKHKMIAGSYNVLKDKQLVEKGIMKYLRKGFRGEITEIPAIKYEPPKTIKAKGLVPYRYVSALIYPVKDDTGKIINVVLQHEDITDRIEVENKIKESEEEAREVSHLLATIINSAPVGFCLFDTDLRYLMINKGLADINGVSTEEHIGKSIHEIIPSLEESATKGLRKVLRTGKPILNLELTGETKSEPGKIKHWREDYFPIHSTQGKIIGLGAIIIDITARKEAENRLKDNDERLQLALDAGSIGVWDWDILTNKVKWSEKVYEIHGLKKTDFDNEYITYTQQIYPEDKKRVEAAIEQALQNKKPYDIEFRIITAKKDVKWITTSAKVIYDNGKPVRMLGATIDITRRKELENQKNEFIAIASHELKTPVTSIKSFGQVLQLKFRKEGNKEAAELLGKMDSQVNKLTNLIGDLLDVTKIETGKIQFSMSRFAFDDLIHELVEEMQRTTQKHSIYVKGQTKKKITGDRDRIGQVITNLLSNAIKYSPHTDKIIVQSSADKKSVTVCVQDFGVGIPPEKRDKVFERFFRISGQGKETYPGLGLGLYISAEIIRRQGGKIWVESNPGKGSKFFFTLPLTVNKTSAKRKLLDK